MCCEGETCNEWIFAVLFSPNVYSCRLTKRGNIFFSPNQKDSEWKTIKDANTLKSSLPSRSRLHFTCSRTNFSLFKKVREESSSLDQLLFPSSALTLQTCVCSTRAHTKSHRESPWEWSVTARLAALALPLQSCASLHALQWVSLARTVMLLGGWVSLYICIWEHCWHFPSTCYKRTSKGLRWLHINLFIIVHTP